MLAFVPLTPVLKVLLLGTTACFVAALMAMASKRWRLALVFGLGASLLALRTLLELDVWSRLMAVAYIAAGTVAITCATLLVLSVPRPSRRARPPEREEEPRVVTTAPLAPQPYQKGRRRLRQESVAVRQVPEASVRRAV